MTVREIIVSPGDVTEKIFGPERVTERLGTQGIPGKGSLYIGNVPPTNPNYPYLRFQLDDDGAIEMIYFGSP